MCCVFFFQAEDGIRNISVTGVQTCALPIWTGAAALLPRPLQRDLARQAGMSEADVSRCLSDPAADLLRRLWAVAEGLGLVLEIGRASGRGRVEILGGAGSLTKKKNRPTHA